MSDASDVDSIWAQIPDVHCKGKCQEACGPVWCSPAEERRIRMDYNTAISFNHSTLTCSLLANGRCSIYSSRPAICRLWGAVKKMRCPFGCRPRKWISDQKAGRLLRRLDRIP